MEDEENEDEEEGAKEEEGAEEKEKPKGEKEEKELPSPSAELSDVIKLWYKSYQEHHENTFTF